MRTVREGKGRPVGTFAGGVGGGRGHGFAPSPGAAVSAILVVKATDGNKFKPVHKYISKGDKVRWKNADTTRTT